MCQRCFNAAALAQRQLLGKQGVDGFEGRDVAAQHRLQVLVHDECRPDQPGVAQHHREQPNDAKGAGLVGELGAKLSKVDLSLLARRRLEPTLEPDGGCRPHLAQEFRQLAVAAGIPESALPPLLRFCRPEIFNTDQGNQFTSAAFTGTLVAAGIRISTDGRGRWMDNVFHRAPVAVAEV